MIEIEPEILIGMLVSVAGIVAIIAGALAWLYTHGKQAGIDKACGKKIESEIKLIKDELGEHQQESGEAKKTLHKRIDETHERITEVATQVATVEGKQDAMMEFLKNKL